MNPEADNGKRLKAVKAFYSDPTSSIAVRKQVLCLRLTLFATSITAQKKKASDDKDPILVRLGKREIQKRTSLLLADILQRLRDDPALDIGKTVLALLLTESHLIIRFDIYSRFPTRLWRLTKKFNPQHYTVDILEFLYTAEALLDAGYSLILQKEAWAYAKGVEAQAVGYLMSPAVQAEIEGFLEQGSASSLEGERKHQQDKRSETVKVTGCARASRNSIIRRYLTKRRSVTTSMFVTGAKAR